MYESYYDNYIFTSVDIQPNSYKNKVLISPYLMKNNRRGNKLSLQTCLFFTQNTTQHTIDTKSRFLQQVENIHEFGRSSMIVCRLYSRWWQDESCPGWSQDLIRFLATFMNLLLACQPYLKVKNIPKIYYIHQIFFLG